MAFILMGVQWCGSGVTYFENKFIIMKRSKSNNNITFTNRRCTRFAIFDFKTQTENCNVILITIMRHNPFGLLIKLAAGSMKTKMIGTVFV